MYGVLINYGSKLGPYMGRLAKTNPTLVSDVAFRMRAAGAKSVTGIASMIEWAKANPVNSGLIAATLAQMGHSVYSLFDNPEDPEVAKVVEGFNTVTTTARSKMSQKARDMIEKAGAHDEHFNTELATEDNEARITATKEVLKFAQDRFGGVVQSKLAHKYMQAFFEMPKAEVDFGFAHLNLADVRYTL